MIRLFCLFDILDVDTALKQPDDTFTSPLRSLDFSPTIDNS